MSVRVCVCVQKPFYRTNAAVSAQAVAVAAAAMAQVNFFLS